MIWRDLVKLDKIYTRGGDGGETSLGDGQRVAKHDPNVAALGAVDEANAAVGLVRLHTQGEADDILGRIQNDLFDLGADLAVPMGSRAHALRMTQNHVARLEGEIDALNAKLAPLMSFVLPGGTEVSAHLHLACAMTRRAERLICKLAATTAINPLSVAYVNRLSDHLFTLARSLNDDATDLWKPGENSKLP